MSPHRSSLLAYWHSGGCLESRSGPLTRLRALELFRFYAHQAFEAFERRDVAAVIFCARTSIDIAAAIAAADAWRAASVRVSHENKALSLRKS
jgi:hypothetical protein